jgi:hypothetical protein
MRRLVISFLTLAFIAGFSSTGAAETVTYVLQTPGVV